MKTTRGFTLIELLVVIAIIGLLAAVVLASLGTAKSKGQDAAVEQQMTSIKNAAELYYSTHSGQYGASVGTPGSCGDGISGNGSVMWADTKTNMLALITAVDTATKGTGVQFSQMDCGTTTGASTAWSVAVQLPSSLAPGATNIFFCIDSTGFASTNVKDGTLANSPYSALVGGTVNGSRAHVNAGDTVCN